MLMLAGIDDPKLASHPSSSSHSMPRAPTIMGGLVLRLQCILSLSVGRQSVSATVTAV